MLITPHVFIDTTVFDQNSHNYSSATFQRLNELVKEDKIKIYLTSITVREVEAHIKESVENAQANIQSVLGNHRFLRNVTHPSLTALSTGIDVEGVIGALLKSFREWVSEMSVDIIPIEDVSIEEVFDRYFSRRPPFEEKKKAEFPDAFALSALERWCKEHSARMYVISGDSGMYAACELSRSLKPSKSLPEFLNMLVSGEQQAIYADTLFEAHKLEIRERIEGALGYINLWPYEPHGEVQYTHIDSVRILEKYLVEVSDRQALFEVTARVNYSAKILYHNYAIGMMMGLASGWSEEYKRNSNQIQAEVSLIFDKHDQNVFRVENVYIQNSNILAYPSDDDLLWHHETDE